MRSSKAIAARRPYRRILFSDVEILGPENGLPIVQVLDHPLVPRQAYRC
jgi:hypothetical protein